MRAMAVNLKHDLIGLGGYKGMPFARATRAHVGAAIELIEHLPAEERPSR